MKLTYVLNYNEKILFYFLKELLILDLNLDIERSLIQALICYTGKRDEYSFN